MQNSFHKEFMKMKALRTEPVCTEVRGHLGCTVSPLCSSLSIDLDLTSRYKTPAWGRTEEVFSFSVFDVLLFQRVPLGRARLFCSAL